MAEYTKEEYLRKIELAKNAQDAGAIDYFNKKIKEIENEEILFQKKSNALAANDDKAVEYFNERIQNETRFGDTGLKGNELIFDNLNKYEGYNKDLISYYSKEQNRPRTGNVDSMYDRQGNWIGNEDDLKTLKEKNFEYWNATTLNVLQMGETALELSKLNDGEKDVAKNLFETYEKTKITGEGSRSGFEQMKDAWHILYDPLTWVGGKFLMAPAQKAATRKGIMLALTKGKDPVIKNAADKIKVARKLKESEKTRNFADSAAKFVGPRTADDFAENTSKILASQKATAERAKFSLKKKLIQDGLSQQEANAVVKAAAKSTARRSSGVGAGYTGIYDAALQTGIQNQFDPNREFSVTQNLAATGLGAGFGYATPAAGKFASWALQKPGSMVQNALPRLKDTITDPLGVIRDPIARSLGGKKAARTGVAEEAELMFKDKVSKGSAEAAEDAFNNLKQGKSEGFKRFEREYEELGDLENVDDLMGLKAAKEDPNEAIKYLEDPESTLLTRDLKEIEQSLNNVNSPNRAQAPIQDLKFTINNINNGNISPTQGLREFRRIIGDASNNANLGKAVDRSILKNANNEIKSLFNKAAKRAGKEDQAKAIDKQYGKFANTLSDKKISSMLDKASDTQRQMKSAISAGNSSLIREHLDNVRKLSKFSDNPAAFMKTHEKALRDISNEVMFSGQTAATFKRYLSNADGKSILKQIYPDLKTTIDRLATIQKNSEAGSTMGMFAMRLMTTGVAGFYGFGVAGPIGTALVGGSGYILVEKMLASKAFQKMAMKTFSKEPTKNPSQLLATTKWFQKRFPKLSEDEVNKLGNIVFGGSLWGYVLSETDNLNGKIRSGIKFTGDTGQDVINFLTQENVREGAAQDLDQVAQQLGVTNLPGFQDNSFSNFQQDPSLITR